METIRTPAVDVIEGSADQQPWETYYQDVGSNYLEERGVDAAGFAERINTVFDGAVINSYLGPVLSHLRDVDKIRSAAQHARVIGVDKSTTRGWWNLFEEGEESRIQQPALRTFLFTLAGFGIECGEVLPSGQEVALRAWKDCLLKARRKKAVEIRDIPRDEIICLQVVWTCDEWWAASTTGDAEEYRNAAVLITETIKSHVPHSKIRTLDDIRDVLRRLFMDGTMVFAVLRRRWLIG